MVKWAFVVLLVSGGVGWAQVQTSTMTHVATNQIIFPYQLSSADGVQIVRSRVQLFPGGSLFPFWEQNGRDISGVARYRNLGSDKCMDIESTFDGARVVQRSCSNAASQKWRIECREKGCILYNTAANRCLTASGNYFFGLPVGLTINTCDFSFNNLTQLWVGFT